MMQGMMLARTVARSASGSSLVPSLWISCGQPEASGVAT